MQIIEFEIEIIAPKELVPAKDYDLDFTAFILARLKNAAFKAIGEFLWDEEGSTGRPLLSQDGHEPCGFDPVGGFTEEHKRSLLVDLHIARKWQCGDEDLCATWLKVDEKSRNLKLKMEIAACDDVIYYDLLNCAGSGRFKRECLRGFLRHLSCRIKWAVQEHVFMLCDNDKELDSVVVKLHPLSKYYREFPDIPEWATATPSRHTP